MRSVEEAIYQHRKATREQPIPTNVPVGSRVQSFSDSTIYYKDPAGKLHAVATTLAEYAESWWIL